LERVVKANNQKVVDLEQKWEEESDEMMEKINSLEIEMDVLKSEKEKLEGKHKTLEEMYD
jgi:peptidoglycan hydrolase CwlO-like protein